MSFPRKIRISNFEFRIWQFNKQSFSTNKGFTLIELLIVISIIAILIASASYSWRNAQVKGRDGKRKSDLKAVQQALELYFQNNGKYPTATSGKITCSDGSIISWSNQFICPTGGTTYMQQLPKDPVTSNQYYYLNTDAVNFLKYTLFTQLENSNDPDLSSCNGITPPAQTPPYNYCALNP